MTAPKAPKGPSPADVAVACRKLEAELKANAPAINRVLDDFEDDARDHERGRCGGLAQGCPACDAEADAQDGRR